MSMVAIVLTVTGELASTAGPSPILGIIDSIQDSQILGSNITVASCSSLDGADNVYFQNQLHFSINQRSLIPSFGDIALYSALQTPSFRRIDDNRIVYQYLLCLRQSHYPDLLSPRVHEHD